jgi:hypothetical protein
MHWFASVLACSAALLSLGACSSTPSSSDQGDGGDAGTSDLDGSMAFDTSGQVPVGDGGPCVVATSVPAGQVPAYVPVVQQLNRCSTAQIGDFVSSCTGSTSSPTACDTFQTATANADCMACLIPTTDGGAGTNSGAILLDYSGTLIVGPNTPGCIALADPTNGPACAAGLEPLFQCETQACGSADCRTATASAYEVCLMSTETGACMAQYNASAPCASEYTDGGAAVGACATDTQILNVICGAGM